MKHLIIQLLYRTVSGGHRPSTAMAAAGKSTEYVAENRSAVISIKDFLRGEGYKLSGNAIAKGAARAGKVIKVIGIAVAATTASQAYYTCMSK